jgi:hypothetical protein
MAFGGKRWEEKEAEQRVVHFYKREFGGCVITVACKYSKVVLCSNGMDGCEVLLQHTLRSP